MSQASQIAPFRFSRQSSLRALAAGWSLGMSLLLPGVSHGQSPAIDAERQNAGRPNLVLVLADDLDALTAPIWDALPQTQRLLKDRGLSFDHAYSPTPICCAARASILTGQYGHNTGVLTNGGEYGGWETFVANGGEDVTFALALHDAGYRTALIGKYMNGIEADALHIPPGWDDWVVGTDINFYTGYNYTLNDNGLPLSFGENPEDYSTDVLVGRALDFLDETEVNDEQPFLLYFAPTAPHLPLPPAPRHADNPYRNATAPHRANFNEADITDKSSWLRASGGRRQTSVLRWNDTDFANRMGSLYALDEAVAQLVQRLLEDGELDNTWIIFTSDNGYNLGSHRLLHKMAPYDESVRIPLVAWGPGVRQGTDSRFALLTDLAPTFLELAGVPVPDRIDGRSLVPLLTGNATPSWRSDFVGQYRGGDAVNSIGLELPPAFVYLATGLDVPTWRALRTTDYLYIEWYDEAEIGFHEYELYNLKKDPYELNNLLRNAITSIPYRNLAAQLQSRLDQLTACAGLNCRP